MRPDDTRPTTPIVVPPRESNLSTSGRSVHASEAANVVRGQIDAIYDTSTTERALGQTPVIAQTENLQYSHQQQDATNPYHRTHNEQEHQLETSAWQKYHTAWQSYYQQYYERYYVSQVHEAKKSLESQTPNQPAVEPTITTDEAMYDIRSKLRNEVEVRATKVRKSRHFMPAMAAVAVMLVFLFMQYNRVIFASVEAYVTPGSMDPSSLIVDPSAQGTVGPEPRLIIPKINVDVPIVWDAVAADQNSLNAAMDKGVAWFNIPGANARPGERGNFALSGHSSNDWLDKGDYKFIFARLEQMKEGDVIYVNSNSIRYTYKITKMVVVKPTDVSALTYATDKPEITLITCTPLGTALNRLLVVGEQVSPDPGAATEVSTASTSTATKMPSNSPTFLQRLFGGN